MPRPADRTSVAFTITLLSTTLAEAPVFGALARSEHVRVVSTIAALDEADDGIIVVGPAFADSHSHGVIPLICHRPTVVVCADDDIDATLDAGAIDVLPLDCTMVHLERALRLSGARFVARTRLTTRVDDLRAAIGMLPIGVAGIENDKVIYANPALQALCGQPLLGLSVDALVHPDDRTIWNAPQRPAEIRLSTAADCASPLVEVSAPSVLSTRDGEIQLLTFRDVTEERALAARLHQAERNASLRSVALEIAHEVNNPLAIFSQDLPEMADMVSTWTGPGRDVAEEVLDEMKFAADRIAQSIARLRNAADEVMAVEFGVALDAARAGIQVSDAAQFFYAPLDARTRSIRLDVDAATITPLLSSALTFAATTAASVAVAVQMQGDFLECRCTLGGVDAVLANGTLDGELTPGRLSRVDQAAAKALSVELSIARRARIQLLLDRTADGARLTLRLPCAPQKPPPAPPRADHVGNDVDLFEVIQDAYFGNVASS